MKPAELFALPVATRLHWWDGQTDGQVVGRMNDRLMIVWGGGEETVVSPTDDDLREFAATLEVIEYSVEVELPIIVDADE